MGYNTIEFRENTKDEEKKTMFYEANIKSWLSEQNAREKSEEDFKQYKEIMAVIENPTEDVSVLEVEKGGRITK